MSMIQVADVGVGISGQEGMQVKEPIRFTVSATITARRQLERLPEAARTRGVTRGRIVTASFVT